MYRAYGILIHIHIHTRVPRDSTLYTLVNNRSRFGKKFGSRLVSGPVAGSEGESRSVYRLVPAL
jgi:hypothetical protein